jgi:anti-sigma factor RsiW
MSTTGVHVTTDQLNLLIDGRLPESEAYLMSNHLASCDMCRSLHARLRDVDRALRGLPLETTSAEFTGRVMGLILTRRRSPVLFRILENVAYVFGLLIVLGVMTAAFLLTGVLDTQQVQLTRDVTEGFATRVWETVGSGVGDFSALLVTYFPFAFSGNGVSMVLFTVLAVGLLAGIDRFVLRSAQQR